MPTEPICVLYPDRSWRGLVAISQFFLLLLSTSSVDAQPVAEAPKEAEDSIQRTIDSTNLTHSRVRAGWLLPDESITRWVQWRHSVLDALSLDVSFSYDSVAMGAWGGNGDTGGVSGDAAVNLRWHIIPDSSGAPVTLAVRVRERTAFSDLAPSELRRATNALWGYVDGFTDADVEMPECYLERRMFEKQLILRLGQMSIDDLMDDHQLRSAKRSFLNQAFSSNPAVGFPSYGLGLVARWESQHRWDLTVGISNMQSPNLTDEARWLYDAEALFGGLQIGRNFDGLKHREARFQILGWHADELEDYQLSAGSGVSATFDQALAGRTRAYIRYAGSTGEAAVAAHLMTIGFAKDFRDFDRFGTALSAGESSADPGQWQGVLEVFYRRQIGPALQISPDVQIVVGNGLGGARLIAGIRASLSF